MERDEPIELIRQCWHEVEATLPSLQITESAVRGEWAAALGDHTVYSIEYDAALDRLVVATEVGRVPLSGKERTYELLLEYNALWRHTQGVRMALEGPDRCVSLVFEISRAAASASRMADLFQELAAIRQAWAIILRAAHDAEADGARLSPSPTSYA
jgi:hypothetical protein